MAKRKQVKGKAARESALWEAIGPLAVNALQEWVQSFEAVVAGKPKLSDVTLAAFESRNSLLSPIVEAIVRHVVEAWCDVKRTECPTCSQPVFRKRLGKRQLLTLVGPMVVPDPYFYCDRCQAGWSPVAATLELAGAVRQYDVQAMLTQLAAKMSYDEAVEIGKLVVGEKLAVSTTHEHLQAVAEATKLETVIPSAAELDRRVSEARTTLERDPVVVVAADGAMTPTRPQGGRRHRRGSGQWRETKGFRVLLETDEQESATLASWHQIADAESFREALALVASRLPQEGIQVVVIADGAPWIWAALTACFPKAIQVLDYFHLAEHVFDCAHAQYGETLRAEQWALVMLARLSSNHVSDALGGLRRMIPRSMDAQKEIEGLLRYLTTHRERLDYHARKQSNLPIGSGPIESANKTIVHRRMKLSGAWWLEANANGMLRLRCALANGTFDAVMRAYILSTNPVPKEAARKS